MAGDSGFSSNYSYSMRPQHPLSYRNAQTQTWGSSNAQTRTSRTRRHPYKRISESQTPQGKPFRRESFLNEGSSWHSRWNRGSGLVERRFSAISGLHSVHLPPSRNDSSMQDWEHDLAAFRMSWYTNLELSDLHHEQQSEDGNETKDPNLVDWDGPDDPESPLNWPTWFKWANIITFSTITMIR